MNVLTIGSFDGLHVGHLELLRLSRRIADGGRLVVGLNRDEFIERYKGRPPVHTFAHRREMLEALDVDAVVVNAGDEQAATCIDIVAPDVLTIGDDWLDRPSPGVSDHARYYKQLGVTQEWMTARGLYVIYIERTRGVSSSALRALA